MNIHVGNVPYAATEEDLEALFSEYGPVATTTIVRDRDTDRSKGFGYVEMENQEDGEQAIEALDGQKMMERELKVSRKHGSFHNPYTFVPSPPRPLDCIKSGDFAGDFNPLGPEHNLCHSSFEDDLWTGYIPIKLITVTPLVLLDAGEEDRSSDVHQTYDVLDYIPEPSLRGMLRSAYEVVTNSRYGNFSQDEPLEYSVKPKQRKKYDKSPLELLDLSLHPASSLWTLSPADRLFGWVPSPISAHYGLNKDAEPIEQHVNRIKYLIENSSKDLTAHAYVYQSLQYLKEQASNEFSNLMQDETIKEIYTECEKRIKRDGRGYKSRIRVVCEDGSRPEIIQRFQDSNGDNKHLPLVILSEPKPTYGRFYVAKDSDGNPQDNGCLSKEEAGYSDNKGLRGRKQYWHHQGLEAEQMPEYWKPLIDKKNQGPNRKGLYQEYFRVGEDGKPQKDHQNRSIRGWIKPDTKFRVSLHVQNLKCEEVGALLWLLTLPEKHYFKFGYGKPLGFGSVKIKIDKSQCVNGYLPLGTLKHWQKYYTALDESPPASLDQACCIRKFRTSMIDAYSVSSKNKAGEEDLDDQQLKKVFNELSFIKEFLQILRGPAMDAPIHYPRIENKPNPKDENFRWFSANDSEAEGLKLALPKATDKKTLPYEARKQKPSYKLNGVGSKEDQHAERVERLASAASTDTNAAGAVRESLKYLEENDSNKFQELMEDPVVKGTYSPD